jgi:sulfur transfer complex TusBCD TusB component (DsrH family)
MDEHETYLGDGVYASFDGYQIWLAINHHENKVVALEPSVLARLWQYAETLKEKNT